ncbi:MAG: Mitochondrial outer membrane protein iml2 [Phylliscum demangeonii]|nr:MAG: Mitochondrial outer membrane protein iml2 [Phylliscum demangeonii]
MMERMGSWLGGKPKPNPSALSLNTFEEQQSLDQAIRAATHLMNDEIVAAEAILVKGSSSFHKLGRGMVSFMRATLGFEREAMQEASEQLADAETTATSDLRRAQRDPHNRSMASVYPPGAEFALCQAQSQLLGAVVAVLTESVTASLGGFYKLRKAYLTLNGIIESESKLALAVVGGNVVRSHLDTPPGSAAGRSEGSLVVSGDEEKQSYHPAAAMHQFISAQEKSDLSTLPHPGSIHSGVASTPDQMMHSSVTSNFTAPSRPTSRRRSGNLLTNPIDLFIYSGSNLCFGLLLLMISMIPPAFGRLLSIVGFRGDRERGLELLWKASRFSDANGGMAALALLGYYTGVFSFCDIILDDSTDLTKGYPKRRCEELLADMRKRYPKSRFWLLEGAKMKAANRQLEEAVDMLAGDVKGQLRQIEALATFEQSLMMMYVHRYEQASDGFLKCTKLNNWSHGLYYYIAGCARIEMYRKMKEANPELAAKHAEAGESLLRKVLEHTGKKRIMNRQGPWDTFVSRKIQKWEHRAQERKIDFVDAIGVSPIEEMIYLWNGYKRMGPAHLDDSLQVLQAWAMTQDSGHAHTHAHASSKAPSEAHRAKDDLDERAIHALLHATALRNLDQHDAAREILQREILRHDRSAFKGHLKDDWACPCAHYEMAVICWKERRGGGPATAATTATTPESGEANKIRECAEWLDQVAKWESYDLDARCGLKVATAQLTVRAAAQAGLHHTHVDAAGHSSAH